MRKLIQLAGWLAIFSMVNCRAETIVALTSGNRLLFFDNATPGTITRSIAISNVAGETLVAIDFRPVTGELYAMAASGHFYVVSLPSGVSQVLSTTPIPLGGTRFGFDFNPVTDRIRVTSDTDLNLRINPNDGSLTMSDPVPSYTAGDPHFGANPNVVGCAHNNNFFGAVATVLYEIDSNLDIVVTQHPADSGILKTVGNLGT